MKASTILQNFAGQTTLHGVPKVIVARSTVGRCIWATICLAAGFVFLVQLAEVLDRYLSYPKKVTIEVVAIPVPFPAVSICNMRNLDFHVLNTINRLFIENEYPKEHVNYTDSHFVREYMKMFAKYGPLWYEYQDKSDYRTVFQEVFSRTTISANIPEEVISSAAIQLDEFFVTCFFGGNKCNLSTDFSTFFDSYYYNCFTYTAPPMTDGTPEEAKRDSDLMSLSEGVESGWSVVVLTGNGMLTWNSDIRLTPGIHETLSPVAASEGVRVVIHPSDTQPFPFAEGYDVPPGYSASFGVRPRRNIRIGSPHGNCSRSNPFDKDTDDFSEKNQSADDQRTSSYSNSDSDFTIGGNTNKQHHDRYRRISCQKMCLQHHVIAECNCYDTSLPVLPEYRHEQRRSSEYSEYEQDGRPSVKPCRLNEEINDSCMDNATDDCLEALMTVYNRIKCARRTRDTVNRNTTSMELCGCHPPCNEFQYDVSYSLSKWPATGFEGDSAYYDIFYVENFRERFNNSAKSESIWNYFLDENRNTTMNNFARLNVYIADSNVVVTRETPDFEVNQLVSDIGGQLGIWVGISVITLSEVVELIYLLLHHFLSARRSFRGTSSTSVRKTTNETNPELDSKNSSTALTTSTSACGGSDCGLDDSRNGKSSGSVHYASGGSSAKDCCSIGSSCRGGRQVDPTITDEELGWIEYDRRYRPNEYMTYSRRSGTGTSYAGGTTSGTANGFTFEPMDRDRSVVYRSLLWPPRLAIAGRPSISGVS